MCILLMPGFTWRKPEVYLGDIYAWLYALEKFLHQYIRETLRQEYGEHWCRKGIPDTNGAECAAALEPDPEPACRASLLHDFGTPKRRL